MTRPVAEGVMYMQIGADLYKPCWTRTALT